MSMELHWRNQKDNLAPEEKKMSEIQNNVLNVQPLQNMHGLLMIIIIIIIILLFVITYLSLL